MPKKCVFGCPFRKDQILHGFPSYKRFPERFRTWVEIAGGNLDDPSDYELYQKSIVCDIHFTMQEKNRYRRLSAAAVPSLHLNGKGEPRLYQKAKKADNPNRSKSNAEQKPAHVSSTEPYQCPVKSYDDTKIILTQFHIDNVFQEICDEAPGLIFKKSKGKPSQDLECADLKLKIPRRTYMYKIIARPRQLEDLPKTGIVKEVPSETHANEELCHVIEGDHCAEVSRVQPEVKPEILFSWQQPSAVVPCDDDVIYETGASNNECIKPELKVESTENATLYGYRCNECSGSIVGFRYTCVQCADYDICGSCEACGAHPLHYVLRVPGQRPHGEVTHVLHRIRRLLLADAVIDLPPGEIMEIKKEPCDVEDPIAGDILFEQHDPTTVDSYFHQEVDPPVIYFCDEDVPITNHLSCDEGVPVTKRTSCNQDDPSCDEKYWITKRLSCDEDDHPLIKHLSCDEDDPITKELSCDKDDPLTKHFSRDEDDPMEVVSFEADDLKSKQSSCIEVDPGGQICKEDDTVAEQTFKDDPIKIQSFKDDPITESCEDDDPIVSSPSCEEGNSMAFKSSWSNTQKSMPVLKHTGSFTPEPVKLSRAVDFRSGADWTSKHTSSVPLKKIIINIPKMSKTERLPVISHTKQFHTTQRVRRSIVAPTAKLKFIDITTLPDHVWKNMKIRMKTPAIPNIQSSKEAVVRVRRLSAAEIKAALHKS